MERNNSTTVSYACLTGRLYHRQKIRFRCGTILPDSSDYI